MHKRVSWLIGIIGLFCGAVLLAHALRPQPVSAAALLSAARATITAPQPGQTIHFSYTVWKRPPPAALEPADPYHVPFDRLWPTVQVVDTWMELDAAGDIVRWRTQLHNAEGERQQDLLFADGMETNYMALDGFTTTFPAQVRRYQDQRLALIDGFLQQGDLQRETAVDWQGTPVTAVYGPRESLAEVEWDPATAVLSLASPFIADLEPVARAYRIDLNPDTGVPVGTAEVVWDRAGAVHLVSYRTLSAPQEAPAAETAALFTPTFPNSTPPVSRQLSGLDAVVAAAPFLLYELAAIDGLVLASASLNQPQTAGVPSPLVEARVNAQHAPVAQLTYTQSDGGASVSISIMQGTAAEMQTLLAHSRHTWTVATPTTVNANGRMVEGWLLTGPDEKRPRAVLEMEDTILFVEADGFTAEEVGALMANLQPVSSAN